MTFQTRWTMSYLRGPLSRDQIRSLMSDRQVRRQRAAAAAADAPSHLLRPGAAPLAASSQINCPVLPPGIQQFFIPRPSPGSQAARSIPPWFSAPPESGSPTPSWASTRCATSFTRRRSAPAPSRWTGSRARRLDVAVGAILRRAPESGASFESLPSAAAQPKNYAAWEKSFKQWLTQNERLELLRHRESDLTSRAGRDRGRLQGSRAGRGSRARATRRWRAVRQKYAAKQAALAERLRRAEAAVTRESEQSSQQKLQAAVSIGATLVGALLGRKAISTGTLGRATTAARGVAGR